MSSLVPTWTWGTAVSPAWPSAAVA